MIDYKRAAIWKHYNENTPAREEAERCRKVAEDVERSFRVSFRQFYWLGTDDQRRQKLILERKEKRNRAWKHYIANELAVRCGL